MEKIISKEELEKISQIEGKTRGTGILDEMEFVVEKEGKEGLKRLEESMGKLGYPIKYNQIEPMAFYPLSWYALFQLSAKKLFDYNDEDFQEMGRFESKISLIMRLFMKYFVSINKIIEKVPIMWRKYYSIGEIKVVDVSGQERRSTIRLLDFPLPHTNCQVLRGYFSSVVQMVVGGKVTCEETKCIHRGDEYHEFLLKW